MVILVIDNLQLLPQWLRSDRVIGAVAGLAVLQAAIFVVWRTAPDLSIGRTDPQKIESIVAQGSLQMEDFGVDEYLPDVRKIPGPGEACRDLRSISPAGRYELSFEIAAGDADACIHIPRFWNVRYAASIDGEATPVYANADGEILIVPAGQHGRFDLRLTRPAYVTGSMLLSGVAAALFLLGAAWSLVSAPGSMRSGAAAARRLAQVPQGSFAGEPRRVLRTRKRFWLSLILIVSLLSIALLALARGRDIVPLIYILS